LYQQTFNPSGYTGFFGIGEAVVASNSMEPELCENDLIFYLEVDPQEIAINDIIVYEKTSSTGEPMLIVHQVIDVENGYITTQGINNAVPDEPFPVSWVIGKYIFKIGQFGILLNALSTPMAPLVIILLLVIVFVLRIALYYMHKKKVIKNISTNDYTRAALNHFFDI
jgi:signal peptidase I